MTPAARALLALAVYSLLLAALAWHRGYSAGLTEGAEIRRQLNRALPQRMEHQRHGR